MMFTPCAETTPKRKTVPENSGACAVLSLGERFEKQQICGVLGTTGPFKQRDDGSTGD